MTLYALSRSLFTQPDGTRQWVDIDMEWTGSAVSITGTDDEEEIFRLTMPETRWIAELKLMTERRMKDVDPGTGT